MTNGAETAKKRTTWKGWLAVLVIFVVLPIVGILVLWRDRCTDSVLAVLPGPDGTYTAETYVRDCGTKIEPATMVRVLRKESGETVDEKDVLLLHGKHDVTATWKGATDLELGVSETATVVKYARAWEAVKVDLRKS